MDTKRSHARSSLVAILLVVLVALLVFILVNMLRETDELMKLDASSEVREAQADELVVYDAKPDTQMTLMSQYDVRWSEVKYLYGTIGSSGCGLVCATMAIDYLTDRLWTPVDVVSMVGGSCSESGVNDMGLFSQWMCSIDSSLLCSEQLWTLESFRSNINYSKAQVAFAGVSDMFGERTYGGHVVLLYMFSDSGCMVADPASEANCRFFSWREIEEASISYYYIVETEYKYT